MSIQPVIILSRGFRLGTLIFLLLSASSHAVVHGLWEPWPRGAESPLRGSFGLPYEQPYTIEGGRVAVDVRAIAFGHDLSNPYFADYILERISMVRTEVRVGVVSGLEIRCLLPDFNIQNRWLAGRYFQYIGVGDLSFGLKWGRAMEEGDDVPLSAAAVATYRTSPLMPTNGTRGQSVSLAIPVEITLPSVYRVTLVPQGLFENRWSDQWTPVLQLGALFSGTIRNRIRFHLSLDGKVDTSIPERFEVSGDVGLAWGIGNDWVVWGGSRFGLTLPAEDVMPYVGVSFRL